MLAIIIFPNFYYWIMFFLDFKHIIYAVYLHLPSLTFSSF